MDAPPSVSASDTHVNKRPAAETNPVGIGANQVYSGFQQATTSSQPFGVGIPVLGSGGVVVFTPLNTYYSYEITQILYKK
ncbi:hypothetical protein G6F66_014865 [Rhizopus arrhizus]|nr:hypothetical protein G6F66_014865 [Rhizopus arrhizus]